MSSSAGCGSTIIHKHTVVYCSLDFKLLLLLETLYLRNHPALSNQRFSKGSVALTRPAAKRIDRAGAL